MQALTQSEAAEFLRLPLSTFKLLAKRNAIPVAKLGRRCVYLSDDLINFVKTMQNTRAASTKLEGNECQSSNVVAFGGAMLQHQAESELDALLEHRTNSRPRRPTTK